VFESVRSSSFRELKPDVYMEITKTIERHFAAGCPASGIWKH
jgi:hypothetical protein